MKVRKNKMYSEYSKEAIAEILQHRDDISSNEAWNLIDSCQEEICDMLTDPDTTLEDLYDTVEYYFGLEPEYLDDFLNF